MEKIVLVENNEISMDNKTNSEVMNDYFVNITQNMGIPEFNKEIPPTEAECLDPIDKIIYNFKKHPSVMKINNIIKNAERFTFNEIDQVGMEK